MPDTPAPSPLQRRLHALVDGRPAPGDRLGQVVHWCTVALIVATIATLIVATVPDVRARAGGALRAFDVATGSCFLVEYLIRLWTAPVDPRYGAGWRGRLRWARSPLALLDLLAVVALLVPSLPSVLGESRLVRLLALLRVLKLGRVGDSLALTARVLRTRRDDLLLAGAGLSMLLLFGSTLMYHAEHDAQPKVFASIPRTLWWGVVTLTTVGYGDMYPVTTAGRLVAAVTAVLGVGSFALVTAILGGAFLEEVQRARTLRGETHCPTCGHALHGHAHAPTGRGPHAPDRSDAG